MPPAVNKKVVLEMTDGPSNMRLNGEVFASADLVNPVRRKVNVRRAASRTLLLTSGNYVYVFDVVGASGAFTIGASEAGQGTLSGNTSDGVAGRKLRFKVA